MTNQARVGIFTTITIIVFILGFYFLKGRNLFVRTNSYYAVYDRVDGLYKSNIVEVDGYRVGMVGGMERDQKNRKIIVQLDLDKDLILPKSDSTVALLFSTDLFGSKKIQLILGHAEESYKEGDTINTFFKTDLTEALGSNIDPVITDVRKIIPQLDTTIRSIKLLLSPQNVNGIFGTVKQLNGAIAKIDTILIMNKEGIHALINNIEGITATIEKDKETIDAILNNAKNFTDTLQQANLKQTISNLNDALVQLKGMVNDINSGKGTVGKLIKSDELYANIDSTVNNLNKLVKDVKARPYRYISINVLGAKKAEERRAKKYDETGKP